MSETPSLLKRVDNTHLPMIVARLVLGNLFILYGFHKLGDPVDFLKQIKEYQLLPLSPPEYMNLTAVVLPWFEIICGNLLIAGLWLRGAAFSILAMLLVFTAAILMRALRVWGEGEQAFLDIAFDCGCGGGVIIIWKKLVINGSMIVLSIIALLSRSRKLALDTLPEKQAPAEPVTTEPEMP